MSWIDPQGIQFVLPRLPLLKRSGITLQRDLIGRTIPGDWDLEAQELDSLAVFGSVERHVADGVPWEETSYVREARRAIAHGARYFKISSDADLRRVIDRLERMQLEMIRTGYMSQRELGTGRPWDEVVVALDRTGRPLFLDGRHRLALARALGIPTIPIVIAARHPDWVDRARLLLGNAVSLDHPDLAPALPSRPVASFEDGVLGLLAAGRLRPIRGDV